MIADDIRDKIGFIESKPVITRQDRLRLNSFYALLHRVEAEENDGS